MDALKKLETLTADQPQNPMRPLVRQGYEEEIKRLDGMVGAPAWQGGDRGKAARRSRELRQMIDGQIPKPIADGKTKDEVHHLSEEVLREVIQPAMLPLDVMKRNPAGALRAYQRGEGSKGVKRAILAVKRARLALEAESGDPDTANLEPYRPGGYDGFSRVDAQIPGKFAQTPAAKANWPLGDPTVRTAVGDVKNRERVTAPASRKPQMTEAQRQVNRDRLLLGRALKGQIKNPETLKRLGFAPREE
jgi:hypothetical protein